MIERRYDVHGVGLAFRTNDPALAEAVHGRLERFGEADSIELEFEFLVDPAARLERPAGDARRVYEPVDGEVAYYDEEDLLVIERGRARLVCAPEKGSSRGVAPDASDAMLWMLSRPFLTLPLIEALKRRGLFSVHAACVSRGGRGILLAGGSGAGKTTLALVLARAGLDLLSDDMVFLRTTGDGIEVLAFPDEIDVTDETLAMVPEAGNGGPGRPGWPKRQLPIDAFGRVAPRCSADVLVFCRVGAAAAVLEPVDEGRALVELSPNVLLTAPQASQRHFDALGQLARTARSYELEIGGDPERLGELLLTRLAAEAT